MYWKFNGDNFDAKTVRNHERVGCVVSFSYGRSVVDKNVYKSTNKLIEFRERIIMTVVIA